MKTGYQAEVPLKKDTEFDDLTIRVEGRADGIITEEDIICIDEIKGVYKDVKLLEEPVCGPSGTGHVLRVDLCRPE